MFAYLVWLQNGQVEASWDKNKFHIWIWPGNWLLFVVLSFSTSEVETRNIRIASCGGTNGLCRLSLLLQPSPHLGYVASTFWALMTRETVWAMNSGQWPKSLQSKREGKGPFSDWDPTFGLWSLHLYVVENTSQDLNSLNIELSWVRMSLLTSACSPWYLQLLCSA